jgi:hypothetical protein
MQKRTSRSRREALKLALIGATGFWPRFTFASAQGEEKPAETKVPATPDEHFARASHYDAKAKEYRQEAALHKKMLKDELEALPPKLKSSGPEPGWIQKMRKHCEGYIRQAEALAQEAERFAEFHRMRGREMKGE